MTRLDFIKAWLELRDARKISERLKLDTHTVANIAAQLRNRGVELPKLPSPPPANRRSTIFTEPLDVPALNKFILER